MLQLNVVWWLVLTVPLLLLLGALSLVLVSRRRFSRPRKV